VEQIRGATRQALQALVELALGEDVIFILIAGDLYDGDWKDYNTGLFFAALMTKLREAGVKVFIVDGNHDAASNMTKHLRLPENVKRLSSRNPESIELGDLGVVVHGQSFHTKAVSDDLAAKFPLARPSLFNIGLLHTSATGRPGHEPYAPCTLEDLLSKGYDYWALGHVHQREVLHQEPWVLFSGNIQGRHVRETGPKGCTLVTVDDGKVVSVEHQDLDVLRWSICQVDASGAENPQEALDLLLNRLEEEIDLSAGRPLALRLRLFGPCRAHAELAMKGDQWISEIRAMATDLSGGAIWIEKVLFETQTEANLEEMLARQDTLGSLLRGIRDLSLDDRLLKDLQAEFGDLNRKIPAELKMGGGLAGLENQETYRQTLDNVKQLLLGRLLNRGAGQ
jgi:predicted phosphodiesterase